jgi:hypothetical protein
LIDFVALGVGGVDKIDKLRGCYFVKKEDPSVFVNPVPEIPPIRGAMAGTQHQLLLGIDCKGFKFALTKLLQPYIADKISNHPPKRYWCKMCDMCHNAHNGRCAKLSADLFVAMTNYVCYNHYWVGDLMPSDWLDVECSNDQRKTLNPTPCDVQVGAIIGQIFGDNAKTTTAKRHIDIMIGNINSCAQILNGPQLDSIKMYNDLAASLSEYNNEVKAQKVSVQAEKKNADAEKAANKVRRDQQAKEQQLLLLPICEEHAIQGLTHCLSLSLVTMKEV